MRFSRHQLLALILGAGMTSALQAQSIPVQPRPRVAGARGTAAPGAMRRSEGPVAMMIAQRDTLSLTDNQVAQLQALERSTAPQPQLADMMQARKELQLATAGEANLDAARAAMDRIARIESDMLIARLDARNKARALLNTYQQAKFDTMEASRPMMPGLAGMMDGSAGMNAGGRSGRFRPSAQAPASVPPSR